MQRAGSGTGAGPLHMATGGTGAACWFRFMRIDSRNPSYGTFAGVLRHSSDGCFPENRGIPPFLISSFSDSVCHPLGILSIRSGSVPIPLAWRAWGSHGQAEGAGKERDRGITSCFRPMGPQPIRPSSISRDFANAFTARSPPRHHDARYWHHENFR